MTMIVEGNNAKVEQVRKQLDKLIEVVKIVDITDESPVSRELALIKIKATPATRSEIIEIVDIFRANIVDVSTDSLMIEVTGDEDKMESLLALLKGFGIREIARTGLIALPRGGAGPLAIDEDKMTRRTRKPSSVATGTPPDW
jgi:acetolactate synthase-1/3 small subunit